MISMYLVELCIFVPEEHLVDRKTLIRFQNIRFAGTIRATYYPINKSPELSKITQ